MSSSAFNNDIAAAPLLQRMLQTPVLYVRLDKVLHVPLLVYTVIVLAIFVYF
jgi:hypothetical protein